MRKRKESVVLCIWDTGLEFTGGAENRHGKRNLESRTPWKVTKFYLPKKNFVTIKPPHFS
jgi:hypothetical protein